MAPISEESQRLVGTWIGGGMLAPVYHTFSQDGTYVREAYVREAPELVERATGMWKLDGTKLTRSLGKAETVDEIVKSDKDFFQIRTKDGSTWGYNRRAARGH